MTRRTSNSFTPAGARHATRHGRRWTAPIPMALLGLCAVLWLPGDLWAASFQVSPTRFEFPLDKRYTEFFTVTNTAADPVRLRVYPKFVTFDADNKLLEGVQSPHDLSRWVVLSPRRLSLQPEQRQVVRFSVRPPSGLTGGEYRTVIFFEELPPPPDPEQPLQGEESQYQLRLLTRLGVPLYGMAGAKSVGVLLGNEGVTTQGNQVVLRAQLTNQSNAYLVLIPRVRLLDADGDEVYRYEGRIVLQRDQTLNWSHAVDRPVAGSYTLSFSATHEDETILSQTFAVRVDPPTQE